MQVTLGQRFSVRDNSERVSKLKLSYKENPNMVLSSLSGKPLLTHGTHEVVMVDQNVDNGAFFINTGEADCHNNWDSADIILQDVRDGYDLIDAEVK